MTPALRKQRLSSTLHSEPFRPAHGLSNPHAQTVFAPAMRPTTKVGFLPERWPTPDDDFLRVFVAEGAPEAPVVIVIHGLEGSVESSYVPGIASLVHRRGSTVVAYEQRGCGGEMNRAKRLYHSGLTDDIAYVSQRVCARWPDRPIYVAGVSLGGNQLGKWLGTETIPDAVRAATIISPPFDLTISGPHMDHRMWIYVRHFLRTLIPKALEKSEQYPGVLDNAKIAQARTFAEFDTHATAALHGFRDALDYYQQVSCGQFLGEISIPTLVIASEDDPFNPGETIPRRVVASSDHLVGLFPPLGGHVGFVSGLMHRPQYWAEERCAQFFELCHSLD